MKVSLNTVKQFTPVDIPVDELVVKINQQLGGVEDVIDLNERYKDAVIVKVLSAEKHANADKLSVCIVDDGGAVKDVERDKDGYVQIVCGAPNVHGDMYAIWLPSKSTVPASFDDKEPFVLDVREIRGVLSNGMLAAADELGIGTDHSGIIEIDPNEWRPYDAEIKPGASFAECYGLNDMIIDIENKMFTHRPDLFGQLGVAREISAILGGVTAPEEGNVDTRYENPDWYWRLPEFESASNLELKPFNDATEKVPRLMFVAMNNVKVKPSPLWMQCALTAMGSKSINNVVDVTNYVMLLTAQPTHAYDYDKLAGHTVGARMAKKGEKVSLLNGKDYELTRDDIVIADAKGPIGLAGIMGGGNSEVSAETKNIVLEVGTFDMYAVRKSSMRHGLFTDALTRFNKGQSPLQNNRIINLLMTSIKDVSPAQQASDVYDLGDKDYTRVESLSYELPVATSFINQRLGIDLTTDQIGNLLRRANFASYASDDDEHTLLITAPFWRTDIVDPEDIVEEVGRLYGFDKLPRELPLRHTTPAPKNAELELKQSIRSKLATAGANEVLTYSFVHEKVLKNAGQNPEKAFKLSNALSPDLQYYRLSVLPSLLAHVHSNIRAGHDEFLLFELGKGHHKEYFDDQKLPIEFSRLAGVYADKSESNDAPYYHAKSIIQGLLNDTGVQNVRYQSLSEFDYGEHDVLRQLAAPFVENRSAMLWVGEKFFGIVGEFKPAVIRDFKLPENSAGFELFLSLFETGAGGRAYQPLSRYPSTWQDISLKVSAEIPYADVFATAQKAATGSKDIDVELSPLSIYQSEKDVSSKTITLRVKLTHHDRTLKEADAAAVIDSIALAAAGEHSATVV